MRAAVPAHLRTTVLRPRGGGPNATGGGEIVVDRETDRAWFGRPTANPNVTEPLEYPKYAWEEAK